METKPTIGISSCLLGERVRYDGQDKRDQPLIGFVSDYFNVVPVCPEMGAGLGVPRPPVQLVGDPLQPRALGVRCRELDVTEQLERYAREKADGLGMVSGFIFKVRSPSCGPDTPLYDVNGVEIGRTQGIFYRVLTDRYPLLPVEDEEGLRQSVNTGRFLLKVLLYSYWLQLANKSSGKREFKALSESYAAVFSRWESDNPIQRDVPSIPFTAPSGLMSCNEIERRLRELN